MSEYVENQNRMSDDAGNWLGWLAIIIGVIGFFWQPIWMGIISIVLAAIGLASPKKTLNGWGLAVGIIALIIGIV